MRAGLVDAVRWLADNVPIYAVNVLLSTATDMWALCYPETHPLYLLDRRDGAAPFGLALYSKRIRARSEHLRGWPAVVFATEPMGAGQRWQLITAGELVHVDADLAITREVVFPDPPTHPLRHADLSLAAARAQHPLA